MALDRETQQQGGSVERLEDILLRLAQQHAPQVMRVWKPDDPQRVARLARVLASYNVLVIVGDFPQNLLGVSQDMGAEIQKWVDGYGQMYLLLARSLFPSFIGVKAEYADPRWPVVVTVRGDSAPVIEVLAGLVAPYIAARQTEAVVSEIELIGLMEIILETLEAANLPRDAYKRLVNDGVVLLKRLLMASIRQLPLTNFDRRVFTDSERFIPLPPEPPTLPEEDSGLLGDTRVDVTTLRPEQAAYTPPDTQTLTATQSLNPSDNHAAKPSEPPSFFVPRRGEGKRRPPVPRLPGDED